MTKKEIEQERNKVFNFMKDSGFKKTRDVTKRANNYYLKHLAEEATKAYTDLEQFHNIMLDLGYESKTVYNTIKGKKEIIDYRYNVNGHSIKKVKKEFNLVY